MLRIMELWINVTDYNVDMLDCGWELVKFEDDLVLLIKEY